MKPICVKCQRFYKCDRNGTPVLEQMPDGASPSAMPGTVESRRWSPYKLWQGDRWKCPGCGSLIIVGVANRPISEHFHENFQIELGYAGGDAVLRVNDC